MGKGAGDLNIKAECRLLIQTFTVTDGTYAHIDEVTYNSSISSGDYVYFIDESVSLSFPTDFELSFKLKSNINGSRFMIFSKSHYSKGGYYNASSNPRNITPTLGLFGGINSSTRDVQVRPNPSIGSLSGNNQGYYTFKLIYENGVFTAYCDDQLVGTQTFTSIFGSDSDFTPVFWIWRSGTIYVKDIIIKPL